MRRVYSIDTAIIETAVCDSDRLTLWQRLQYRRRLCSSAVEWKRNVTAHAQKPDSVFQRNGRVHLYRLGCQFSRVLAFLECGWRRTIVVEWKRNLVAHGDAREEKWRGKRRMEWVATSLQLDSHSKKASTRLNWHSRQYKWTRPFRWKTESGFCACAITFHFHSNTGWTVPSQAEDCWLPTPFVSFPFTSPPVRRRVPPDSVPTLPSEAEHVRNVMAHAQKPDLVFQRNGRVHLNCRVGGSVQSTTGSRGVRISGSNGRNAGYNMFWGKVQDYWLPTPLAWFPFTSPTVRHRVPSHFNWALPRNIQ